MPLPLAQPPLQDHLALHAERAHRAFNIPRPLALWHLASFDAPSVAIAWSLGFAWIAHLHLASRVLFVLALTTWWIYVSDRLLDARAGLRLHRPAELHERHFFHWRHRRAFAPLAIAAALVSGLIAIPFLPLIVRERGSILAVASFAYFSRVHAKHEAPRPAFFPSRFATKEFLVGMLFSAGCILPAWSRFAGIAFTKSSLWLLWIPGIYFAILVWLNCWCISRWESSSSPSGSAEADPQTRRAPSVTVAFAALVAFAGLLLAVIAPAGELRAGALLSAGAVSALLLGLLDSARPRITPLALRVSADLVMLTPLVLLFR